MNEFRKVYERAATKYAEHMEMLLTESVNVKQGEGVSMEPGMHMDLTAEKDLPKCLSEIDVKKKTITLAIGMIVLAVVGETMKELEGEQLD